ncbi:hypothetical protein V8G54_009130 [Vigna mungo]|uniref:Uncharacterized protein n=1 Tax=Vigna mungo TaxID=3915 RepID=A0AAQ3NXG1_VIGMU
MKIADSIEFLIGRWMAGLFEGAEIPFRELEIDDGMDFLLKQWREVFCEPLRCQSDGSMSRHHARTAPLKASNNALELLNWRMFGALKGRKLEESERIVTQGLTQEYKG